MTVQNFLKTYFMIMIIKDKYKSKRLMINNRSITFRFSIKLILETNKIYFQINPRILGSQEKM